MGKKRCRAKKVSKGTRRSVARENLVRATASDKLFNRLKAIKAGKKVSHLITNPDLDNIKKAPFVRVVY